MLITEPTPYRMFFRRLTRPPFTPYPGTPKQIAHHIIESCWQKNYMSVSNGHFKDFYCRDFGMCTQALCALGYQDKVLKTLNWALHIFEHHNILTTTINSRQQPVNFFHYGIDSLPFILKSIYELLRYEPKAQALRKRFFTFLQQQLHIYQTYFTSEGLALTNTRFSEIKDHYLRPSSCYAVCMGGMTAYYAKKLGLPTTLTNIDFRSTLIEHYYTGTHFRDHVQTDIGSGDAQVFPFYAHIIPHNYLFDACIHYIQQQQLDKPFPLKYTQKAVQDKRSTLATYFASDYETNTCWIHLGLCHIQNVLTYDVALAKAYLQSYTDLIHQHKNFLEVYTAQGKPYGSAWYITDESMIWVSMYLHMIQRLHM
ncbi:MAG: hypothetical protein ACMXYC_01475 [Candidatus Woesearchaeota archaeon]